MFAWIEAGRSNTFGALAVKDVVFRTATVSNNLLIGNASNSADTAALYIHENRVGVRRLPMLGANVDVLGEAAISRSLRLYATENVRSNYADITSNCVNASHSNLAFVAPSGSPHVYLDATGYVRLNVCVGAQYRNVASAFSNQTVLSATTAWVSNVTTEQLTLTLIDEYNPVLADDVQRGSQLLVGDVPYRVTGVRSGSNTWSLDLRTATPDDRLVRDVRIGAGSNVVVEVLDEASPPTERDDATIQLDSTTYQVLQAGRLLRLLVVPAVQNSPSYEQICRHMGRFVMLSRTDEDNATRRRVVCVVAYAEKSTSAVGESFSVDFVAPDGTAFASDAAQRVRLSVDTPVTLRPLEPDPACLAFDEVLLDVVTVSLDDPAADTNSTTTVLRLQLPPAQDPNHDVLDASIGSSAETDGNNLVRLAVAVAGATPRIVRLSVTASAYDRPNRRLLLHVYTAQPAFATDLLPLLQDATYVTTSARLRLCARSVLRVTAAEAIDRRKLRLTLSTPPGVELSAALVAEAQRSAAVCHVAGLASASPAFRILAYDPTAGTLDLRATDFGQVTLPEVAVAFWSPLLLLRPLRQEGFGRPCAMPWGATIGGFKSQTAHQALTIDGDVGIRSALYLRDPWSSGLDMRVGYSCNVLTYAYAPSILELEQVAPPAEPLLAMSTSNVRLRSMLMVDGQVTAKTVRTTSDVRLKRDIEDSSPTSDLAALLALPVRRFRFTLSNNDYNENNENNKHVGVLAQDVEKSLPSAVGTSAPLTVPCSWSGIVTSDTAVALSDEIREAEIGPGDGLDWVAEDGAVGVAVVRRVQSTRVTDVERVEIHVLPSAAPQGALPAPGSRVTFVGRRLANVRVIDTTELLCLTMSALKQVYSELQEVKSRM